MFVGLPRNIASFTADRKEAAVEFADAIGEYWEGRLDLLIHGYRVDLTIDHLCLSRTWSK
ncbi:hypothetical protein M3Y99_01281600 [Aphelenchoides fujianensis]|nr:hypothetical protein M3Y99_01281600 [Aphelenchoides fujianensis]